MPDPLRSREDLPKQEQKKKKRKIGGGGGGGGYHLPMFMHTHTHTHTQNSSLDTSDSLTLNWGGEKASPSFLYRLPPNQTLKTQTNREKNKFALVTHTQPEHRRLALQNCYTHKMAELVRGRFTA